MGRRRTAGPASLLAALGLAPAILLPPQSLQAQITPPTEARRTQTPRRTGARADLVEAIAWYTGTAGRVDDERAAELLREAESEEDALARMWIARVHSRGRMGFVHDETLARRLAAAEIGAVRRLAASGDIEATFLMGTAFDEGLGVRVDFGEAMRWYRRAAARGHILAAHNVGNMYRDGRGVPADDGIAAAWWLRAAHAGDVIPALRLGEAYEAGRGVPRDRERARAWFSRARDAGNPVAAEALARLGG